MEQPQCAGSVIQIGPIQRPADRIAEGTRALGRNDVNGHMLGLRHLHYRPRWRGNDLERSGYPRTGAPGRVGDDDDSRKNILRQYRTQCRPEETHILLNGDHSRNAGIHILPMRIRSRRHGVGQRLMNIAITCRTHKLPVYAPDLKGVCVELRLLPVLSLISTAFALAHAAPNTESLIMVDGPFQALFTHFAFGAHTLGITGRASLFREERLRIGLRAQRLVLPRYIAIRSE